MFWCCSGSGLEKKDSQTVHRDTDFTVRSGATQTLDCALLCTCKSAGTNGDKQEVVNRKVSFYHHASINSILNVNMKKIKIKFNREISSDTQHD